jgi:6,7-dimethyl-8-ribityllumazine synthase
MILIITSQFNWQITSQMQKSATDVLHDAQKNYEVFSVPGAAELPVAAQHLIRKYKPSAVIVIACVIKGSTNHYEYVIDACTQGLTRVAIDESTPIIQGVLPCQDFHQAWERKGHGAQFAETALEMVKLLVAK